MYVVSYPAPPVTAVNLISESTLISVTVDPSHDVTSPCTPVPTCVKISPLANLTALLNVNLVSGPVSRMLIIVSIDCCKRFLEPLSFSNPVASI